jgi:hypothetical protein
MDAASYLPAFAALAGSAIGGLTSFASAWLTQGHQERAKRLSGEKTRRQKLYKQFIDEASKLYADALVHDQAEISALVSVYALISRMRVVSSTAVIEKAEAVVHLIIDTYFTPNKTFFRISRVDERPRRQSAAGFQRGMQGRITGTQ